MRPQDRQTIIDEKEAELEKLVLALESMEEKELQSTSKYKKVAEEYEKKLEFYEKLVDRHLELLGNESSTLVQ